MSKICDGDILVVKTTDPLAEYDFPNYCQSTGHILLQIEKLNNCIKFHLKKVLNN